MAHIPDDLLVEAIRHLPHAGREPPSALDVGLLGRVFGARHADTNIAAMVIVVAAILLAGVVVSGSYEQGREIVTGMIGLISASLGYAFGSRRYR